MKSKARDSDEKTLNPSSVSEEKQSARIARQKRESERKYNHRDQRAYAKRVNYRYQAAYELRTNRAAQKAYKARKRAEKRAKAMSQLSANNPESDEKNDANKPPDE